VKTDFDLGKKVNQHLLSLGVETPIVNSPVRLESRISVIEEQFKILHNVLGLDLKDDSLSETPLRIAKMLVNETFSGLNYENFPKATVVENKFKYDEMVVERNIKVNSLCEHHWKDILGFAHVAYIPNKKVLGLSKLNRIVDFFSRRPQIQERLTCQIFETLKYLLDTEDIAVFIEAEHLCVKTRGIMDACSDTATSKLGGAFKSNPSVRAEFFSIVNMK
jgi:GTP cyclohydrolase IA